MNNEPEVMEAEKPLRHRLAVWLESGTYDKVRHLLAALHPVDIAALLRSSPPKERAIIWNLLGDDAESKILQHVDEEIVGDLLAGKSSAELALLLDNIDSDDDVIDILQQLPDTVTHQILQSMGSQNRARIENLLSYPEDTAGGLMNTDTVSVRPDVTLDVVLRYLRRHQDLPASTDAIYVVNESNDYLGWLPITRLLVSDPSLTVHQVMSNEVEPIDVNLAEQEVAVLFERYNLISAPVIDANRQLVGRITIDDVVDVIMDGADHSLLGMAGLTEDEDAFAPVMKTARSRAFWLGANLITAFVASAVINLFEETITKVVALAILMPIVASMGGVAGSQTLTLVIRTMAQGDLSPSNQRWFMHRELAVGTINGVFWAIVVALTAGLVFRDVTLGTIIGVALIINMVTAALCGTVLPGMLKSMRIDPAIAGTVVLTTITDVVGFMSFLGLAAIFYA
jgi:magnesium transporter